MKRRSRRKFLTAAGGLAAAAALPSITTAQSTRTPPNNMPDVIRKLVGPAQINQGRVKLGLPPLVENGYELRLAGRGQPGAHGHPPGDLYLVVEVEPHPFFRREGCDLVCDLPVTVGEAVAGARVEVLTPEGWLPVPLPAGLCGGERLRLRGRGIDDQKGGRGDLYLHVSVRLPDASAAVTREVERLEGLYRVPVRRDLRW